MIHAGSLEEIQPLVDLCRAGRLFDIQEWIRDGKAIAAPENSGAKGSRRNPLRIAMECGFHSLVQVLLEAGAPHFDGSYNALHHAVDSRRPDLAALLFKHGAKANEVSMRYVLDMWNPEMVELFLANGGDLEAGLPVAWTLIHRMRPALGLLKRLGEEQPGLMAQADIALRFHAYEGNVKWVSLLLWAGANPWARGPEQIDDDEPDESEDYSEYMNTVELAAYAGLADVLKLKQIATALTPERPETVILMEHACHAHDSRALTFLLAKGYRPEMLSDLGTRAIETLLHCLSWDYFLQGGTSWDGSRIASRLDSSRARECMKMIHMLVANGAKWMPQNKRDIGEIRRSLLKMKPDYSLEFAWLMNAYKAARRSDVHELFRTASINRLLGEERERLNQILAGIPEELPNDKHNARSL